MANDDTATEFGNELIFACAGLRHEPAGTVATFEVTYKGARFDVQVRHA